MNIYISVLLEMAHTKRGTACVHIFKLRVLRKPESNKMIQ